MKSKPVKVWVVWQKNPSNGHWVALTARVRRENALRAVAEFGRDDVKLTSGTVMPPVEGK